MLHVIDEANVLVRMASAPASCASKGVAEQGAQRTKQNQEEKTFQSPVGEVQLLAAQSSPDVEQSW